MLEANFLTMAHIDQKGISKTTKFTHQYDYFGLANELCVTSAVPF